MTNRPNMQASLIGKAIIRLARFMRTAPHSHVRTGDGQLGLSTTHIEQIYTIAALFMNGLRTGGPENDYIAEGWVIRNGMPFSSGENCHAGAVQPAVTIFVAHEHGRITRKPTIQSQAF